MCCSAKAISAAGSRKSCGRACKELRIELKYDNGEPVIKRDQARLQPGPPRLFQDRASCRATTTGSASRSCRRRAASCPTPRRAPPMSAAKSSARCSDHVAHRQESGCRSRRASPSTSRARLSRSRASGRARARRARRRRRSPRKATRSSSSRAPTAAARACSGARRATWSSNMVRRVGRLHHQRSRSTASAIAPRPRPRT